MAAKIETGMEKGDMKRLLAKAKQEPVYCAMAQGPEASVGLLLLHKSKQGLPLEKELTGQFKDAKNPRFGTAFVDLDEDAKLVKFRINKAASGMAKRLVKTLKGTGFSKVVIVLDDEAQTPVDEYSGEEDGDEATEAGTAPAAAAAPPPPPPPPAAPAHDAAALTRLLTALVGRIPQAAGSDAGRRAQLAKLATEAQTALKGGNLAAAEQAISGLNHALSAPAQAAPAAAPGAAPAAAGPVAYAKSRLAWLAARKKMETDIDHLRSQIVATYPEQAGDLDKRYRDRVSAVLATLDESLADALDEATNATDPAARAALVEKAKGIVQTYQSFVAGESLLAELDANPFAPLTIRQTMTTTLAALAGALH